MHRVDCQYLAFVLATRAEEVAAEQWMELLSCVAPGRTWITFECGDDVAGHCRGCSRNGWVDEERPGSAV